MSKNRKIVKRRAIKTAAVMGALVLAASPVIPSVGSFSFQPVKVSAAYSDTAVVSKLDFQNDDTGVYSQGNAGSTEVVVNGETWIVDGTKGKIQDRGTDAQVNAGSVIKVPVAGKGTVTVVSYPGYHNYTVGGQAADADTFSYDFDFGSGSGTVDIVATAQSYLYSITKTQYDYEAVHYKTGDDTVADPDFVFNFSDYSNGSTNYDFSTYENIEYTSDKAGDDAKIGEIIFKSVSTTSKAQIDSGVLRFRNGITLAFPIADDTTAVKVSATYKGNNPDRYIYVGPQENDNKLVMLSTGSSVEVADIDDAVTTINGKKYLLMTSAADNKVMSITIDEYKPVNDVAVSGTVGTDATQVIFKDEAGKLVAGTVNEFGEYSVNLKRTMGNTSYTMSVISADKMVDPSDNVLTLTGNGAEWIKNINLVAAPKATLAGQVTGVDASLLKGDLKVTLVPTDSALSSVELSLTKNGDGSYSFTDASILAGNDYNVVLSNDDDQEVLSKISVESATSYSDINIAVTNKAVQTVKGSFVTSDKAASDVTSITFKNMDTPEYIYTFAVSEGSYTAKLRDGEYETSVVSASGKYTAVDHVSVKDAEVANDVYIQAPEDTSTVAYQSEVKVGQGQQFEKIADAIKYITRMERTDSQRVEVVLTDALYREQLVIDTPNVTFKSALEGGSTLTWYYGVGYSYYSAKKSADGKSAYYDEALAVDKYNKVEISQNPGHWGSTVNLLAGAKGFKAEGITFENSFNRYQTDEEIADGVGTGNQNAKIDRSVKGIDVQAYKNKERAAALYIQCDDTEYKDCQFLSGQDTIYTGDENESSYWKNCTFEGTTDFICGDGNPVFDECTISMYGYSDQVATGSYIVASRAKATYGYLFLNCKIVESKYEGLMSGTKDNYLARSWNRPTQITFINTELERADLINADAFTNMSGSSTVSDSKMREYNTHTSEGAAVDTSGRRDGTIILTAEEAATYTVEKFCGDFVPTYYTNRDVVTVDTSKLYAAIAEAEGFKNSTAKDEYTSVSVDRYLAVAEEAANADKSAMTQDEIDALTKSIEDAKAKLERKEVDAPSENPSEKPTESETTKPSESETTKPTESETTKPTESETTKPTESETTKPTESETTKPSESETTKPSGEVGADKDDVKDTTVAEPTTAADSTASSEQSKSGEVAADTTKTADAGKLGLFAALAALAGGTLALITGKKKEEEEN